MEFEGHQVTFFEVTDAYNDIIDTINRFCATQLARRDISHVTIGPLVKKIFHYIITAAVIMF